MCYDPRAIARHPRDLPVQPHDESGRDRDPVACLQAYLARIGFPGVVTAELMPTLEGLSVRSKTLLGSYMARRARHHLLNFGVGEAALAQFRADRGGGGGAPVQPAQDGDEGPRPDAEGRFEIRVSGAIVSDAEWHGQSRAAELTCPANVRAALDAIPEGAPVLLLVNSPGGDVHAAQEIGDMLDRWEGRVTCRVTGLAASAGALLALLAADEIECTTLAKWMFHEAHVSGLTSHGLRSLAEALEKTDRMQATLLAAASTMTDEEAWAAVSSGDDTWYDAGEAQELGLSRAIGPKPERRQEARLTGLSDRARRQAGLSRELMMLA